MEKKTTFSLKHRVLTLLAALALLGAQSAKASVPLTALEGSGTNANESYAMLVDGKTGTKWCQSMNDGTPYVIFKAPEAFVPVNYYLITGNDTGTQSGRNWSSWKIYGANFASDEEATPDAAGWVLIDDTKDADMPAQNIAPKDFTFTEKPTEAYKYYKIEVIAIADLDGSLMQMSEFNFGTSSESSSIAYTPIAAAEMSRLNDTEGPGRMLDGNVYTKWGSGVFGTAGQTDWIIFKTSRPIKPEWYNYTTANDNAQWTGRNWKDWNIYGGNFVNDEAAAKDAAGWELIDAKSNIGTDVLPDKNYYPVFLRFSKPVEKEYTYFRIDINALQGATFMQISEFFFGDAAIFETLKANYASEYLSFDMDRKFQKSLGEDYLAAVGKIANVKEPEGLQEILDQVGALQGQINSSADAYMNYEVTANNLRNMISDGGLDAEGMAWATPYLNENIAPNDTYPNGSYVYIMENCLIGPDELNAESSRINTVISEHAQQTDDAIVATYEVIAGTDGFNAGESFPSLCDGMDDTKWCCGTDHVNAHGGMPFYVIIRASEGIAPTWYRLFTGNDTGDYSGRNWRTWNIYGANFADDDAAIASYNITDPADANSRPSADWVVIDHKVNYSLPAASNTAVPVYMSNPSKEKYTYFLLEVFETAGDATQQMAELTFGNQANVFKMRDDAVEKYSDYDLTQEAQQSLKDDYTATLENLKKAASISDIVSLDAKLASLQSQMEASVEAYINYRAAVEELDSWRADFPDEASEWITYLDESVAPNSVNPESPFTYGSSLYILDNFSASTSELETEIQRINTFIAMLTDPNNFMVLYGNMNSWGANEDWYKLVDKKYTSAEGDGTKWGGNIPEEGATIIFKTLKESQPVFYTLVTGNDTEGNSGRNWKNWQIWGGNFENDAQATVDAEGWVLMDSKSDVGQDRLPAKNFEPAHFGFSEGNETPYKYYKITITAAYSGGSIQMSEFLFGDENAFETIKEEYSAAARKFNPGKMHAQFDLIDDYDLKIDAIEDATGVEELLVAYNEAVAAQDAIRESDKAYGLLKAAVENTQAFLEVNPLEASDALAVLTEYLEEYGEEDDTYPNGTFAYIYEEQALGTETVLGEIDFLEQLKTAAVAAGYSAGVEITSMVVNPKFSKFVSDNGQIFDGWEGKGFGAGTNEEGTMSAVEFCNEYANFDIHQTMTGLKNGYYEVHINAGFRPCGDIYSTNYAAKVYANDNFTYAKAVIEDMVPAEEAVNRVNCWLEDNIMDKPVQNEDGDTIAWVIWGVQGSCYAFQAGRYENVVVAKVTDGTLTFGVKNEGTNGGGAEWTSVGNARVIYLGSDESDKMLAGMDRAIQNNQGRSATLQAYQGSTGEDYQSKPFFSQAERDALVAADASDATTADAKYALLENYTNIFQSICETKPAYTVLMGGYISVEGKWGANTALSREQMDELVDTMDGILLGLEDGTFSAQSALQAKADLFEKYPDYLAYDAEKNTCPTADVNEVAPFLYEVTMKGGNPYMNAYGFYEEKPAECTVLALDYKSEKALEGGVIYFGKDNLSSARNKALPTLAPTDEVKTVYFDISGEREAYSWGKKDDYIRWKLADTANFTVTIGHIRVISEAQMKAEGGELRISDVLADEKVSGIKEGIYTLQGVRVEKATRGLYIINGKKVLVK